MKAHCDTVLLLYYSPGYTPTAVCDESSYGVSSARCVANSMTLVQNLQSQEKQGGVKTGGWGEDDKIPQK